MEHKKYKVGYTTGVFDLFHVGHLNILKRAKEQCDYLIVGVSTDELCENYKKNKPVIAYEDRCAIIEAIRYVDKVVPQNSMDKEAAWREQKFDAMFVGSDWQGTDSWNNYEKRFSALGVDIVYLPRTEHVSSSMLREKRK